MEGTARRVAVFIGAGALLAALVGFTVWATSSPGQNNRAGFTAEAAGTAGASATSTESSPTTETVTENQTHTRTVRSSANSADSADNNQGVDRGTGAAGHAGSGHERAGAAMPTGYNAAHDPYLPPHAVVAPAPASGQPSRVYRPSNIVPSSARPMAGPQGASPAAEPTPAGQTDARTPSQQTPGSTPPREPGENSAAPTSTPAPGGSEVQPSEATEPTHTPAAEPSKQPQQTQTAEAPEESEQTSQPGRGSGLSHGPDDMGGTGGSDSVQDAASSDAQDAPQTTAGAEFTANAGSPVAGKEDVAGYPQEKEGMTARDVFDKITGRETE